MIKDWLDEYRPSNETEAKDALREIMQEIALAGLYRSGFFEKAAFYGGTALRIFHKLPRFSEDLDFSLLQTDDTFSLDKYQVAIVQEFAAMGMQVSIKEKKKSNQTAINSAFLKSETIWKELQLDDIIPENNLKHVANIKIKLEVDTRPPLNFETEEKLLLRPFSFYVKCFDLPHLFAGKMHALLFRKWQQRVKGRDWYDMEWYIRKGYRLNLDHFITRAHDSGDWHTDRMSENDFREILNAKIESVNFDRVKDDIEPFVKDHSSIGTWSKQYFHDLVAHLKIDV